MESPDGLLPINTPLTLSNSPITTAASTLLSTPHPLHTLPLNHIRNRRISSPTILHVALTTIRNADDAHHDDDYDVSSSILFFHQF